MPQPTAQRPPQSDVDTRNLLGVSFGPGIIGVLLAALLQSLGVWHDQDVVAFAGGPLIMVVGTATLLYTIFGAMHTIHAFGDRILGRTTPLWWQPELVTGSNEDISRPAETPAAFAFPGHVDGAVLSFGLALAGVLILTALA